MTYIKVHNFLKHEYYKRWRIIPCWHKVFHRIKK